MKYIITIVSVLFVSFIIKTYRVYKCRQVIHNRIKVEHESLRRIPKYKSNTEIIEAHKAELARLEALLN